MLLQPPTQQMIEQWKTTWNKYKDQLSPNRKTGEELVVYLKNKYPLSEIYKEDLLRIVTDTVLQNKPLADKLPAGSNPSPVAFYVNNSGSGEQLYQKQDQIFIENHVEKIFVVIDLVSGFFCVEGSSFLWDELYAVQGLDEQDIQNPYCVAEYIACLKRFGLLVNDTGK